MRYVSLDDHALMKLVNLSDKEAFREIYGRYWKRIFNLVKNKLQSHECAAEIVQDIFVDLWERRETLEIESFDRYLFTAAKYKVINYLRRNLSRKNHWDQSLEDISNHIGEHSDSTLELEDLHHALESALGDLPAKTRDIFRLNRLEDQSVKEISALMQIPERTVEYHITQSVRKLRNHLRHFASCTVLLGLILFQ